MGRKRRNQKPSKSAAVTTAADGRLSSARLLAIRVLVFIALGLSAYLLYLSLSGSKALGCGPESGCDQVLSSRWSSWFHVPVSLLAVLADATFLTGTFLLNRNRSTAQQRQGWTIVVPSAVLLTGAALWFVFVQLVLVRSLCPYCMAAHTAGLLASLIALASAPIFAGSDRSPAPNHAAVFITSRSFRHLTFLAFIGVTGLILGQIVYAPKTYIVAEQRLAASLNTNAPTPPTPQTKQSLIPTGSVARIAQPNGVTSPPAAQNTGSATDAVANAVPSTTAASVVPVPGAAPAGQRPFPLYNGRFFIDVANSPTLGSATNAHVAVSLHDFTCSHCRELHPHLVEAQRVFSNQVVIVTLAMPFDPNCNPIMRRHNPKHTNACDYARLSLAVFRANRDRQHDYDEFLFAGEKPPPLAAAQERAALAVGADALQKALNDPWVDQQIRLGIALYETASQAGHGSLPQLMVGQQVAVGILPTDAILQMLTRNLGITP